MQRQRRRAQSRDQVGIVGSDEQRRAVLLLYPTQAVNDQLAVVKVLSARRLIEDQQRWLAARGPGPRPGRCQRRCMRLGKGLCQRLYQRHPLCLP